MTRKRFVKICMSHGMQRNTANEYTAGVAQYESYDELFQQIKPDLYYIPLRKAVDKVGVAFEKMGHAAEKLAENALEKFTFAFGMIEDKYC